MKLLLLIFGLIALSTISTHELKISEIPIQHLESETERNAKLVLHKQFLSWEIK